MCNSSVSRDVQSKTTTRYHVIPIKITGTQNSDNKAQYGVRANENSLALLLGVTIGTILDENHTLHFRDFNPKHPEKLFSMLTENMHKDVFGM